MTDTASSSDELEASPTTAEPPSQDRASSPRADAPRRRRGSIVLYAAAFVSMLAAGACIGVATLDKLEDLGPLRLSWVFSGVAIVAAVAAVVVPRRSR